MSNISVISPKTDRHKRIQKEFLKTSLKAIDVLDGEISGYAVFAWNETGSTHSAQQAGGCVSVYGMTAHVMANLTVHLAANCLEKVEQK